MLQQNMIVEDLNMEGNVSNRDKKTHPPCEHEHWYMVMMQNEV